MRANQATFAVRTLCRVLGVSPSGYYAWRDRPPSARDLENQRLLERMREIHVFSRETYGRPRMYAELRDDGWLVNHKRVGRLMSLDGLQGASRRRKWRTTKRAKDARPAPMSVHPGGNHLPSNSPELRRMGVVDWWPCRSHLTHENAPTTVAKGEGDPLIGAEIGGRLEGHPAAVVRFPTLPDRCTVTGLCNSRQQRAPRGRPRRALSCCAAFLWRNSGGGTRTHDPLINSQML